jgi:cytochrome c oxidase subunit 4
MAAPTTTTHTSDHTSEAAHHEHPADGHYIKIALFLAFLTALETSTYFIDAFEDNTTLLLLFLMPVMALKFGMVAWFFMHLKSDSRMFTRMFLSGIVLAAAVYMIVLLTFDEFF